MPVVFLESPYRWLVLLEELSAVCPDREIFLARELTKLHEECVWGTVAGLREQYAARAGQSPARAIRGELVAVLAPASPRHPDRDTRSEQVVPHAGSQADATPEEC